MTDADLRAALKRGVAITKAGTGRSYYLGRVGIGTYAWCPWCDHDGTLVRNGPRYGERLDAAIAAHLSACEGFAADLAAAIPAAA